MAKKYQASANLFDKDAVILEKEITSSGIVVGHGWFVTDFIEVTPVTLYSSSSFGGSRLEYASKDAVPVYKIESARFTTMYNTRYVRLNGKITSIDTCMINQGEILPYEPYGGSWQNLPVSKRVNNVWVDSDYSVFSDYTIAKMQTLPIAQLQTKSISRLQGGWA